MIWTGSKSSVLFSNLKEDGLMASNPAVPVVIAVAGLAIEVIKYFDGRKLLKL